MTLTTENSGYVHGYSSRESTRLNDQAETLENIIHHDSLFPNGSLILEAGCGVGAQTKIIASKNPGANFISIDISEESVIQAKSEISKLNISNVEFRQGDIFHLNFPDGFFDSVFICFVLEHLSNPIEALNELKRVLRKGGNIMLIEGDHGSTFFYPDSKYAYQSINCQVLLQKLAGGNSNIGRELYPLLKASGFSNVSVSPRMVYVDSSKPGLVDGFIKNTFTAMIEGVRDEAISKGIIEEWVFDKGVEALYRTSESDGVFSYTFFKGFATKL
jgi:ubiquinone/menaquinone biosynthesis C-methylase UbiE